MMPLGEDQLGEALSDAVLSGRIGSPVRRIVTDSRSAEAGDLFWALKGPRHDGEAFLDEAFRRGAAGCVVSRRREHPQGFLVRVPDTAAALLDLASWYQRQMAAVVVGVTGSVGKTSAREMIYSVLAQGGAGIRSRKNYNNRVGLPLSLLDLGPHDRFAVLELGASGPGEIAELAAVCSPRIGVLTAIGHAHLEGFGCLGGVIRAKAELLETLPVDGVAVVNGDDPNACKAAERAACRVVRVGRGTQNDVTASDVQMKPEALAFTVDGQRFSVPVPGRHFLTAALCAVAVGREFGLDDGTIAAGLAACEAPPMRCRAERLNGWTVLNDAYNSSPESARAALELLGDWPSAGKKAVVFGDMRELGPLSARLHEQLGAEVATRSGANLLITCGGYASDVIRGAVESGMPVEQTARMDDPYQVAARLSGWLEDGDVVLVKGSRATAMERVVEGLQELRRREWGPVAEAPTRERVGPIRESEKNQNGKIR
jgi:UDP-N-acetylmuramoyl-tripeptide--D-alanyl-D-alanine ligase